jgi:hypothetical protein
VQQILTNEKYIGNNVDNRRSFKLKRKRVANGPEMWIRSSELVRRNQMLRRPTRTPTMGA